MAGTAHIHAQERPRSLVIACGALATEVIALRRQLGLSDGQMSVQCVPAQYHNTPRQIAPAVARILERQAGRFDNILVVYGECGTGGALDRVLREYDAVRLAGAHCYEFYAGAALFNEIVEEQIGSFFLTDYLLRNFDRLIIEGLGLDRFPHLVDVYFSNYTQLVYLSQTIDQTLLRRAARAADRLGLELRHVHVGYGDLTQAMRALQGDAGEDKGEGAQESCKAVSARAAAGTVKTGTATTGAVATNTAAATGESTISKEQDHVCG